MKDEKLRNGEIELVERNVIVILKNGEYLLNGYI